MITLRARLVRQIEKLGVENRPLPGRDDGFSSLHYRGKAVHPTRSKNSAWIELQFRSKGDVDRVVELIALAIRTL